MQHNFKCKAHNLSGLFQGVNKLSTFIKRLEDQAELDPSNYPRDKYVGDGFEFFIEALLTLMPHDNRLGVSGYEPVRVNDNGCDGIGVNLEGKKCAVQIKFRSNNKYTLSTNKDHLSNVWHDSQIRHGIKFNPTDKIPVFYIFTTAKGLNYYTDDVNFEKHVKCLGYNDLKSLVDNNIPFWDALRSKCI